jgi:hypothetical protein
MVESGNGNIDDVAVLAATAGEEWATDIAEVS